MCRFIRAGFMKLVCLSVCLSRHSPAARRYGGFAAERPAGMRYRSTAATAKRPAAAASQHSAQQPTALGSKCVQCHVDSRRRKLSRLVLTNYNIVRERRAVTLTATVNCCSCWTIPHAAPRRWMHYAVIIIIIINRFV